MAEFVEQEAIIAAQEDVLADSGVNTVDKVLRGMLPGERALLADAADHLADRARRMNRRGDR